MSTHILVITKPCISRSAAELTALDPKGETVRLVASEDAKALFLSGTPLKEPVFSHGPFVVNTRQKILQAMQDCEVGKMGAFTFGIDLDEVKV